MADPAPDRSPYGDVWSLLADDGAGAAEGLALDETLMSRVSRDVPGARPALRLYTYASHAALVGRYQTLSAEVDLDACAATGTAFSRRPTGGGAIVMGEGQLGVALVLPARAARPKDLIEELGGGVVTGLAQLGIEARFGGKNDLICDGRKIAGLGLYADPFGAMLFHTSLLVDLDVEFMLRVLSIPAAKLADKGVAAVGERITTVRRQLGSDIPMNEVRAAIAQGFARRFGDRDGAGPRDPGGGGRRPRAWSSPSTPMTPGCMSSRPSPTAPARRPSARRRGRSACMSRPRAASPRA